MSADIAPTSQNFTPDIAQWVRSAKTAAKTCVVILAVIGAAHVTEPLRADAAVVVPADVKAKVVVPGK